MAEVTNEMLYEEMLKLDERSKQTLESLEELVSFMKETNRELAEGQARTEALKKELFGDRFDRYGAYRG
ncbi:hypothetical protein [Neorhizobium galegae]|uniref:Uncharacterized protein n=1 Tax=Neorhizobium galegae bv. officinalis TaxID=323656 RepID=A0A0T7FL91_NEOGA|nr:hypothetical protein [Neorhizobium galegae]CDZ59287.1 Hypothetical protein NGAL_HAMBI2566_34260 [Neorhizobium galegae bv. orientalis]KAB1125720.1 hypothetical protein F4V90_00910 [Neorhizobium galegae]MCQ1805986.1 hypothetical protein [Neorhizobium galegae]MCQ1836845.1 hypothetical protein [Neorhizobium galegae]UIK07360.1 hypothetical protein LZK81_10560 [Neorhizobium galegae]